MSKKYAALAAVMITGSLTLSACGVGGGSNDEPGDKTITVLTHESWAAPEDLIKEFEKTSGYTVKIQAGGDAGEVTNRLILSKDSPEGDVVYGIDNTFASRAVEEGVLTDYASKDVPASAAQYQLTGGGVDQLTPIDYGDVCINVDNTWFAAQGIAPPVTLDDLVKPEYKDLMVAPGAPTSSPGMAFLIATIGKYGETGWQEYWSKLMANGLKLTSGWTDAYSVDFSGGEGKGSRPIVLSYASSPPFTIPEGGYVPTTSALLDTCFRQVEYAGVIKGTQNEAGAQAFIDFLLSQEFQSAIPDNMYVYPIDDSVALPEVWAKYATPASDPITLDAQTITAQREVWLKEWLEITSG